MLTEDRSNTVRQPRTSPSTLKVYFYYRIMEWEAKAPLGDVEIQSVAAIKAANEQRPDLQLLTVRVLSSHYVAQRLLYDL